jgi:hypothetical protein
MSKMQVSLMLIQTQPAWFGRHPVDNCAVARNLLDFCCAIATMGLSIITAPISFSLGGVP